MGEILIGTASWTDKSLLGAGWYPKGVTSAEDRLRFYAEQFPLVEVDSTYYFPPSEKNSLYPKDREPKIIDGVGDGFLSALVPPHEGGKLGTVLFQYPPWFTIG